MRVLNDILNAFMMILKGLGALALTGMMLLTVADVIFRALGHPILGAVELVGFLATILLACALPYTQRERGHIGVDVLVRRFPPRTQRLIEGGTGALALGLFVLVAWQMYRYAGHMRISGEVSMTLQYPTHVVLYWIALCFAVLCGVILVDVIQAFARALSS